MPTIDFTSKNDIKKLGAAIKEALDKVAAEYGIAVTVSGGTYDPSAGTFKPRVQFAANDANEREFRSYAAMFGLSPDDFGKTFVQGGTTYTVAGLKMKARTRPVICTAGGKSYVFPEDAVKRGLAAAQPSARSGDEVS